MSKGVIIPEMHREIPNARASGPWYGLSPDRESRRTVGGRGWLDDSLTSLDLVHEFADGFLSVETEVIPPEADEEDVWHGWDEWDALRDVLESYVSWPRYASEPDEAFEGPTPPFPITLNITRGDVNIQVDGTPISFARVGDSTRWIAWAQVGKRNIRIRGSNRSCENIRLDSVDPTTYEHYEDQLPKVWHSVEPLDRENFRPVVESLDDEPGDES